MRLPPVVSFDDEPLVLVNDADEELGFATRERCHEGAGLLHRAFSVFLFSSEGNVLLQRRSGQKRLWPGAWSNACCSHPRRGETTDAAVHRRLREELSLATPIRFLFKLHYHARYDDRGGERELCHVYAGRLAGRPVVNANEIAATEMVTAADLDQDVRNRPGRYTPWLKLEWLRLRGEMWPALCEFLTETDGYCARR